jgi:hypothetical protein
MHHRRFGAVLRIEGFAPTNPADGLGEEVDGANCMRCGSARVTGWERVQQHTGWGFGNRSLRECCGVWFRGVTSVVGPGVAHVK